MRLPSVVRCEIRARDGADSTELPALVASTAPRFRLEEVSADKAYLGHANLACIEAAGAVPYGPFKSNSLDKGSPAWRRMWAHFLMRQEDFLAHYHRRSNVESTFSAIKRKFGGAVRSKWFTAQVNEVLCKLLLHNLACIVHAMHELGIEPVFHRSSGRNGGARVSDLNDAEQENVRVALRFLHARARGWTPLVGAALWVQAQDTGEREPGALGQRDIGLPRGGLRWRHDGRHPSRGTFRRLGCARTLDAANRKS